MSYEPATYTIRAAPDMAGQRSSTCRSKVRYASNIHAAAAAGRASRHTDKALRFYRCPQCRGWHLTSKPLRSL